MPHNHTFTPWDTFEADTAGGVVFARYFYRKCLYCGTPEMVPERHLCDL